MILIFIIGVVFGLYLFHSVFFVSNNFRRWYLRVLINDKIKYVFGLKKEINKEEKQLQEMMSY